MEEQSQIYQKGDIVNATVVSASDKALYLEFAEGLSGIMYLNDITSAKLKKQSDIIVYIIKESYLCTNKSVLFNNAKQDRIQNLSRF